VYGIDPNLKRSRGYDLLQSLRHLKAGERFSQPGWGRWAHIDDVAAAVAATVGNPAATGRVYDLVDCYASHADWARIAAEVLGTSVDIDTCGSTLPQRRLNPDAARALGVPFNRGLDGIREHLAALARATAD
jgi:nucleoside-diphosphate-sugar epimerase